MRTSLLSSGLFLGMQWLYGKESVPPEEVTLFQPNALLHIDTEGKVNIWYQKTEMGQGVRTLMAMIAAEELEVGFDRVTISSPSPSSRYTDMSTGGSSSTAATFNGYRKQLAIARSMLIEAAAQLWQVPSSQCYAKDGSVYSRLSSKSFGYGDLVAKAATLSVPDSAPVKEIHDFRLLGKSHVPININDMVNGKAMYGYDTKVKGMVYASLVRTPVVEGKLLSYDDSEARHVPGFIQCVRIEGNAVTSFPEYIRDGVAVVANSTWAAMQAAAKVKVKWYLGQNALFDTASYMQKLKEMADGGGILFREEGDADKAYEEADHVIEAYYEGPFLSHSPLEPMNAIADIQDERCELWVPTHAQDRLLDAAKKITGLDENRIQIHTPLIGGSFGRRLQVDYAIEAMLVSREIKKPVQVVWSRKEDTRYGVYRTPYVQRMKGAVKNGKITAFGQQIACSSVWKLREPDLLSNGLDYTVLMPAKVLAYAIPHIRMSQSIAALEVPIGWYRASYPTINHTVQECWMDELAAAAKRDPLELRLELLEDDRVPLKFAWQEGWGEDVIDRKRLKQVLQKAAKEAGWYEKKDKNTGRGIACHVYNGTYVAQVAEVAIAENKIQVKRVTCAVDCGFVINPDHVVAQMEGGIVFGLSIALHGEITFENGEVVQSGFGDYRVLTMRETPELSVHLIPSTGPVSGVGEPGAHPIMAATCNAIYDATGVRYRTLPIKLNR